MSFKKVLFAPVNKLFSFLLLWFNVKSKVVAMFIKLITLIVTLELYELKVDVKVIEKENPLYLKADQTNITTNSTVEEKLLFHKRQTCPVTSLV